MDHETKNETKNYDERLVGIMQDFTYLLQLQMTDRMREKRQNDKIMEKLDRIIELLESK